MLAILFVGWILLLLLIRFTVPIRISWLTLLYGLLFVSLMIWPKSSNAWRLLELTIWWLAGIITTPYLKQYVRRKRDWLNILHPGSRRNQTGINILDWLFGLFLGGYLAALLSKSWHWPVFRTMAVLLFYGTLPFLWQTIWAVGMIVTVLKDYSQ